MMRIFLFIIFLQPITLFAQFQTMEFGTKRNEIELNCLTGIQYLTLPNYSANPPGIAELVYKYHGTKVTWRFGALYSYQNIGNSLSDDSFNIYQGDLVTKLGIYTGIENKFVYKKFSLFYGLDAGVYQAGLLEEKMKNITVRNDSGAVLIDTTTRLYSYKEREKGITITPFLGLRFKISPVFGISTQAGPELSYFWYNYTYNKLGMPEEKGKDKSQIVNIKPFLYHVSFTFHF